MIRNRRIPLFLAAFPLLTLSGTAAEDGWDQRLANSLSPRLGEIKLRQAEISASLQSLPNIPVDDQGGTGGFASIHAQPIPDKNDPHTVEIRWQSATPVDLVALVPARRYDARGLNARYGMPDDFTVELLDEQGKPLSTVAGEQDTLLQSVRKGHPFVYPISTPQPACGLRITANRLGPASDEENNHVHAWSEIFVFHRESNVALNAKVSSSGGSQPPAPWHWKPEFLVDGKTPLGLPETPEEHRNVGWISNGRDSADHSVSLIADLGSTVETNAIRLVPARKPTADLPSGFGFPQKINISLSETGEEASWKSVLEQDIKNPGHNPVSLAFPPSKSRFVKITASRLWKDFESYPAFFALSELEVLGPAGNLALNKPVRSSDGMLNIIGPGGNYWSGASLTDGFGPNGRLIPTRTWLLALDQRLRLEQELQQLRTEASQLVRSWRNRALAASIVLALAGAFAMIALPIRYRIHARKELLKVRERIAGDLHDEVGSNLGSIQMFADLAEGRSGPSEDLKRIQRIASETVSAVRDIVWLLRPGGEHRIGAVEHLRETASIMLETLKWKFNANESAWLIELPEEFNRHLFLFFREALHNILRHAKASHVEIRVETNEFEFRLTIADDGTGITGERLERPATLRALRQRAQSLAADLQIETSPGNGTRLILTIPIGKKAGKHRKPASNAPLKNEHNPSLP